MSSKYTLEVSNLAVKDLVDNGSILDPQDPMVKFTVGKQTTKTARQKDKGVSADFPETLKFEFPLSEYDSIEIMGEAYNEPSFGFPTLLGKFEKKKLSSLILPEKFNIPITFTYELLSFKENAKGGKGSLSFSAKIIGQAPQTAAASTPSTTNMAAVDKTISSSVAAPASAPAPAAPESIPASTPVSTTALVPASTTTPNATTDGATIAVEASTPTTATANTSQPPSIASSSAVPSGPAKSIPVYITRIETFNLKNVETFGGENDPYVNLSFGASWKAKTSVLNDGGANVHWDYGAGDKDMQFIAMPTDIDNQLSLLKIDVWDKNNMMADKVIGEASSVLPASLLSGPSNQDIPVKFELKDKAGKTTGQVIITVHRHEDEVAKTSKKELKTESTPTSASAKVSSAEAVVADNNDDEEDEPEILIAPSQAKPAPTASPVPLTSIPVHITRIETFNLKNVETFGGENDPYVNLSFGASWKAKTSVLNDGGSNVHWDYGAGDKDMQFIAMPTNIDNPLSLLKIDVWDKNNMMADKVIGEASSVLPASLLSGPSNQDIPVKFELKDKAGKTTGQVIITVHRHEDNPSVVSAATPKAAGSSKATSAPQTPSPSQPEFNAGILKINRIKCSNMDNVEMLMGKNDPYVKIEFGAETMQTIVLEEQGAAALFDLLDFEINVVKDMLLFDNLKLQVIDKNNLRSDVLIGKGEISISSMLSSPIGSEVQFDLDITNLKGKVSGHVSIFLRLEYATAGVQELKVPETLPECSILKIRRIRCLELKNTLAMMDSRVTRPQLKVSFGKTDIASQQTEIFEGAQQGSAVFDNLDYDFDLTVGDLKDSELSIEVINKSLGFDSKIGIGKTLIRKIAVKPKEETELLVTILDKNGGTAGKAIVYAVLEEKQKEITDAEAAPFCKDCCLRIDAITAHNLKNTEWVGSQDPYVVLNFKSWTKRTSTLSSAGPKGHWSDLGLSCDIAGPDILSTKLSVQVFDENTTRKDVLIGSGEVSIKPLILQYAKEIELKIAIVDSKRKSTGFLVISASLTDRDIEEIVVNGFTDDNELVVKRITAHGLVGTNLVSELSSYVVIKMDDKWSVQTEPGVGSEAIWNYLNLLSPAITATQLQQCQLNIEVWQVGTMKNHIIGTGKCSFAKPVHFFDSSVEVTIPLTLNKDVGTIVLELLLHKKPEIMAVKEGPTMEEILDPKFQQGIVMISYAQITGLKNKELFGGKSDPFITFKFGDWEEKTSVHENAGENVLWDDLEIVTDITRASLLVNQLNVEVWDHNNVLKHVLVGSGSASLKRAAHRIGNEIEVAVNLSEPKSGKPSGRVVLRLEIRAGAREPPRQLPPNFTEAMLSIYRIRTFDLKNTELIGKQDPYVILKLNEFKYKTYTAEEQGGDVLFDWLDAKVRVNADTLTNQKLEIEVFDANILLDAFIGKSSTSLKKLVKMNEEVELGVTIKDNNGAPTGRLVLYCKLEEVPPAKETAITLPADLTSAQISIKRIRCLGLRNVGWVPLTKQDPYVELTLGAWKGSTSVAMDAGTDCLWDFLDLELELPANALVEAAFQLSVKDKNVLTDAVIGESVISIKRALTKLGTLVELSSELIGGKDKTKPAGRIILYVEVKKPEPTPVLDPTFAYGTLHIHKIRTFDLANTEFFGAQDPYCVLKYGKWSEKTYTKQEGGSDVLWDFLDIHCDIYAENILSQLLEIEVYDENAGRADVLIGAGSVSVLRCGAHIGAEQELQVTIYDPKAKEKKPTGRVVLFASIEGPEPESAVPEDFQYGNLHIRAISVIGLKTTDWFSKADPYVTVKLNKYSEKTKTLDNAGGNASWDYLDFKVPCDDKDVRVGKLLIEAFDKNNMTDSKLGSAEVSMIRAAGNMKKEVQLTAEFKDAKMKTTGRVVLMARLEPRIVLEPEVVLPSDFVSGMITISKIQAQGLANKEIRGKQDPYIRFQLADWTDCTVTKTNAGGTVTWEGLSTQSEVNRDILKNEKLRIMIMDENTTRQDVILGSGSISLRQLTGPSMNTEKKVKVNLVDDKGAIAGNVIMSITLGPLLPGLALDTIPDGAINYDEGKLVITDASGFNLIGGDMSSLGSIGKFFDKPDPYITFQIGDWNCQTVPINNGDRFPVWKDIPGIETVLSADQIKLLRLKVVVKDKNTMMSDAIMGVGDISLRGWGSHPGLKTMYPIKLKDGRGQRAGHLELQAIMWKLPPKPKDESVGGAPPIRGIVKIKSIQLSELKKGKKELSAELSVGQIWSTKSASTAGVEDGCQWNIATESTLIYDGQLRKFGLGIAIMQKSMMSPAALWGDCTIPTAQILSVPNKFATVTNSISKDGQVVGKVTVEFAYLHDGASMLADIPAGGPASGLESGVPAKLGQQNDQLEKKLTAVNLQLQQMEARFKARLNKELEDERAKMMHALNLQKLELEKALDAMARLNNHAANPIHSDNPPGNIAVNEINNLKLPMDLAKWRTIHVQAWLAFQMELPDYAEAFQRESVDGLLLIEHIDDACLNDNLGVSDELHRKKLLKGIGDLRAKQEKYMKEKEKKRLAAEKKHEEELERRKKEAADAAARAARDKKLAKKKKKKAAAAAKADDTPKKYMGEVREQGVVDRTKIEMEAKKARLAKQARQEKLEQSKSTWKFQYTASKPPTDSNDLYADLDEAISRKQLGSKNYLRALGVIASNDFTNGITTTELDTIRSHKPMRQYVKTIPDRCSFDEILAVVKGAMYEVSTWLIDVDYLLEKRKKSSNRDVDNEQFTGTRTITREPQSVLNIDDEHDKTYVSESDYDIAPHMGDQGAPPTPTITTTDSKAITASASAHEQENLPDDDDGSYADDNDSTDDMPLPGFDDGDEIDLNTKDIDPSPELEHSSSKQSVSFQIPTAKMNSGFDFDDVDEVHPKDRISVIYNAFVQRENNGAHWLGTNSKLTRFKFEGGLEAILKLRMSWENADMLWTKLDYKRSGDIDQAEFKTFFGDLSEFESLEGTKDLNLSSATTNQGMRELTKCLYELCDVMRHAGFSVREMFSGFDRDGSGEISISEFCSLLRLVVGTHFDKKLIYRAIGVLDVDGSKSISIKELSTFIYKIWKSQLADLATQLGDLDEDDELEKKKIAKIVKERNDIKDAIKKNFTRQWRDELERLGAKTLPGPFTALLAHMGIGQQQQEQQTQVSSPGNEHVGNPPVDFMATNTSFGPNSQAFGSTMPRSPSPSSPSSPWKRSVRKHNLVAAGQGQLARFKIRPPSTFVPTRSINGSSSTLGLPPVIKLGSGKFTSSEATHDILSKSQNVEIYS